METNTSMGIPEFPDVYGVGENSRGVQYLYNLYDSEKIIAKKCTSCDEWKFLHQYNKAGKGFAGTHSLCRDCHKENNRLYREDLRLEKEFQDAMDSLSYANCVSDIWDVRDVRTRYVREEEWDDYRKWNNIFGT